MKKVINPKNPGCKYCGLHRFINVDAYSDYECKLRMTEEWDDVNGVIKHYPSTAKFNDEGQCEEWTPGRWYNFLKLIGRAPSSRICTADVLCPPPKDISYD